jgi:putative PIN family toxin of toxin-antitoxin system
MSWELAAELSEVLQRPKLRHYSLGDDDVRELLGIVAAALPTVDIEVEIRDPDDPHVVAAAIAGRADAIVTGDLDLLDDAGLRVWLAERGVEVLTPAQLVDRL